MLKCFYLTCQSLSQLEVQLFVGFLVCMGVRRRQFAYLFSGVGQCALWEITAPESLWDGRVECGLGSQACGDKTA